MNRTHKLKISPFYFMKVMSGNKSFEIRKNDRNFKVGDKLILKEYENGEYTGFYLTEKITYVLKAKEFKDGLKDGYAVLGILKDKGANENEN